MGHFKSTLGVVRQDTVMVRNLPYHFKEAELRDLFFDCGPVASVRMPEDRMTQQSKGFAFIAFVDDKAARKALNYDGHKIMNRPIAVSIAEDRPTKHSESRFSRAERNPERARHERRHERRRRDRSRSDSSSSRHERRRRRRSRSSSSDVDRKHRRKRSHRDERKRRSKDRRKHRRRSYSSDGSEEHYRSRKERRERKDSREPREPAEAQKEERSASPRKSVASSVSSDLSGGQGQAEK